MEYLTDVSRISSNIEDVRDRILNELTDKLPEEFTASGYHQFLVKGKMIRTAFLLLLTEMNGVAVEYVYDVAVSLEMFHIASLIHDDIMDRAHTRRSSSTVNFLFGDSSSALIGDMIMTESLKRMIEKGDRRVAEIMIKSGRLMIKGQLLEYRNSYNYELKEKDYLRIIRLKTAELFSTAAQIVALKCNMDSKAASDLKRFMVRTGLIFQIQDDLIDIRSGVSGKERFIDWREGKVTLPYILLRKADRDLNFDRKEVDEATLEKKFREHRIYETVEKHIDSELKFCTDYLDSYVTLESKRDLVRLVKLLSQRDY